MRPTILFIIAIIAILTGFLLFYNGTTFDIANITARPSYNGLKSQLLPFEKGECLEYDVFYKNMRVGKSSLTFHGEETLDEKSLYHITFSTKVHGFEDIEEIYAYKETFLPYKIFRLIRNAKLLSTKITEEYDQMAFEVKIKRDNNLFIKRSTIKKDAPIYNALLLAYYYRTKQEFSPKEEFKVTLPVASFKIIFNGKDIITTKLGKFMTYVFSGEPSRFTFWLSADENRIPVKIKGHSALDYSFVIKSIGNTEDNKPKENI